MQYTCHYDSPLGRILIAADESGVTGLWFEGQKYFARGLEEEHRENDHPALEAARHWLDLYFSGTDPGVAVPLNPRGTEFQMRVWKILLTIPYGRTMTYGEIAARIAEETGAGHMAAQAVGSAVGHNSISLIIPCHRVIGSNGSLTGYAGGIERKRRLLELEGIQASF